MKTTLLSINFLLLVCKIVLAQSVWTNCNTPVLGNRVDDIYMVNAQTGYAVCGDGQILKTIDWGNDWASLLKDTSVYCRSVKFINLQKGFVGGFPNNSTDKNILRRTDNGGATWTDLSSLLAPRARQGICGLAIADSNTIYGCGNWWSDTAYIVKSTDGGNNWSFIDMSGYAASIIDMHFLNKDTGFASGRGVLPLQTGIILYTTDGGINWTYKYQDTSQYEYCWKIYHLTDQVYFAGVESDLEGSNQKILKSTDGGMSWTPRTVSTYIKYSALQGVGFIDSLKGWTGGHYESSFESDDGGITWDTVSICPEMNRVFKVNDSLLFATGWGIWRYGSLTTGIRPVATPVPHIASVSCFPNPVDKNLHINVSLAIPTHALLALFDDEGNRIKVIENTDKPRGYYSYELNTSMLCAGVYTILLLTHEDKQISKIVVNH